MKVLAVGMALDTNGQKFRYAEAARKWGEDPDILRALAVGREAIAGVADRMAAASADVEGLSIRSAHRSHAYFEFPRDIVWTSRNHDEVRRLADEADVIHLTNDTKAYWRLGQKNLHKPALVHHHGTLFRSNAGGARDRILEQSARFGFVQAVSTHDLLRFAPDELTWLPTCYDLDTLEATRAAYRRPSDGRVRVVSAPTNRDLKSTEKLKAAVTALQAEGLPVDLVLVQGKTWAECLQVKATADIYFDQVATTVDGSVYPGGYGCNAVEAWGMGIPVVAGADDWTLDAMRRDFGKTLPFMVATDTTITDALRALVVSESQRKAYSARGRKHAEKFHAEKPVLLRLVKLYHEAIERRSEAPAEREVHEFALAPGTFRTSRPRAVVTVKNQTYKLREDVDLVIATPALAQAMRRIARYQPDKGIVEVMP